MIIVKDTSAVNLPFLIKIVDIEKESQVSRMGKN